MGLFIFEINIKFGTEDQIHFTVPMLALIKFQRFLATGNVDNNILKYVQNSTGTSSDCVHTVL